MINISNEKYQIQSKLDIERSLEKGEILRKGSSNQTQLANSEIDIATLSAKVIDLQLENETLKKALEDKKEEFDHNKDNYQTIIKTQIEKIKKYEEIQQINKKEIEDLHNKLNQTYDKFKKFDIEKMKSDTKINELLKDLKIMQTKINEITQVSNDKTKMIDALQNSLLKYESESSFLARKLSELKVAV